MHYGTAYTPSISKDVFEILETVDSVDAVRCGVTLRVGRVVA